MNHTMPAEQSQAQESVQTMEDESPVINGALHGMMRASGYIALGGLALAAALL